MIISFTNKDTNKIWEGERIKGLSAEFQEISRRKLSMLNNFIQSESIISGEQYLSGIMETLQC